MVAMYYECGTCGKGFNTGHDAGYNARMNHCISTGHVAPSFECETCPQNFKSEAARLRHMQVEGHRCSGSDMDWECGVCDCFLDTEADREKHEIEDHFYCGECERTFSALKDIKQHLKSNIHGGHVARCPLCAKTDCNVGAVTKHLETGCCPLAPGMNREKMYKLVRSKDPVNRISRPSAFKDRTAKAGVTYVANETTWNGKGYACYICDHAFKDLQSLNSHLNSSKHDEPLYHCPTAGCNATFKTLTAIIAHLESERHNTDQKKLEKFLRNVLPE